MSRGSAGCPRGGDEATGAELQLRARTAQAAGRGRGEGAAQLCPCRARRPGPARWAVGQWGRGLGLSWWRPLRLSYLAWTVYQVCSCDSRSAGTRDKPGAARAGGQERWGPVRRGLSSAPGPARLPRGTEAARGSHCRWLPRSWPGSTHPHVPGPHRVPVPSASDKVSPFSLCARCPDRPSARAASSGAKPHSRDTARPCLRKAALRSSPLRGHVCPTAPVGLEGWGASPRAHHPLQQT